MALAFSGLKQGLRIAPVSHRVAFYLKDFVKELPRLLGLGLIHFLYGISHMNQHQIANHNFFMLQQKQADGPADPTRLAARDKSVYLGNSHGHTKAHSSFLLDGWASVYLI